MPNPEFRHQYAIVPTFLLSLLICMGSACRSPEKLAERYPEGYVISPEGDTTLGFVKSGNLFQDQKQIHFFDYFGGKTTYKPGRIQGFGYRDLHYRARALPKIYVGAFSDTAMFMLRMVDGPTQLYRFYTTRSTFTLKKGPGYFDILVRPDQQVFDISYAFRWKRLALALADYQQLADSIKSDLVKPEDTPDIVRRYNNWYTTQDKPSTAKYKGQ